ncbi:MAG: MFS transporter [Candidatus Bathyarchaeia archaeon]|jgi:MFS family permease
MFISRRNLSICSVLFFIYFTLYLIVSVLLTRYVASAHNLPTVRASVNVVIALSLLLGGLIFRKVNKVHLIYASSIAISISSLLLFFASNESLRIILNLAIGSFFGVGILASITWFWNVTAPEERGRAAGIIGFVGLLFYFVVFYGIAVNFDFFYTIIIIIVLSLGTIITISLKSAKLMQSAKNDDAYKYSEKRTVLLYLLPWVVFSLINTTLANVTSSDVSQLVSQSSVVVLSGFQVLGVIFGAIVGGAVADFFGRRLCLALSLTLYGASVALIGLIQNYQAFSLAYSINGLGWGILLVLYTFVVWGDLANKENCAKMYSLGLATYFGSFALTPLLPQAPQIPLVISALTSCMLIFLSNIPIILAPELFRPDLREKLRMRSYMKTVKKVAKESENQG